MTAANPGPNDVRLGYLVPEYPGQTHVMFQRELEQLAALGVEVDVVSTRRPAPGLSVHPWSDHARRRTTYLFPPSPWVLARMLRAGPRAWWRAATAVRRSERPTAGRVSLLAAALLGARL